MGVNGLTLGRVFLSTILGPVVQKPINANPRLRINQGVYFSTPKCCSTLIFGKNLHWRKSILKNKKWQTKLSPKSGKHETKFTLTLDYVDRLSNNRALE